MYWVYSTIVILMGGISLPALSFDPMAPPGQQGNPVVEKPKSIKRNSGYKLRQIVVSEDRKSAVINGQVVNEGSRIGSALVTRIGVNKVVLNIQGKKKILYLKPTAAKVRR